MSQPKDHLSLDSIVAPQIGTTPDLIAQHELDALEHEAKKLFIEQRKQDIAERKLYANRIFWLVSGWLVATVILIALKGFDGTKIGEFNITFILPESVLIALVGGNAASVIGLLVIVIKYLFTERTPSS